ncbi:hypothetical protein [Streptomyces sp. UH6]|uniref:hypothetical protein n=1 Tax=Streptomyces sp. UH6 TaxID=2748379 RepID=UPI0015D4C2BD|nr:hypothetical protein [Streptomyces sp. UH6]NYV77298.1 hypothetical protein [Streptomyces sp. UH6]
MERLFAIRQFLIMIVALVGGVGLIVFSVIRADTQVTGTPGQFTAQQCETEKTRRSGTTYSCTGSFEADDKSFTIASVEVDTTFDSEPTSPVATKVEGPDATTAVVDDYKKWAVPGGTGVIILIFGVFMLRGRIRSRREDRAEAAAV